VSDPVRCHAGWQYPEYPQSVFWDGQWHQVHSVLKQWRDPQGYYYWVQCKDEVTLELFFDISKDAWQLKCI